MTRTKTKFGSATFDSSQFDVTSDEEELYETVRADIEKIFIENATFCHIIRQTETVDSYKNLTDVSEKHHNVYGLFMENPGKNKKIHTAGLAVTGTATLITKHEYDDDDGGESFVPKVGDIYEDRESKRWRMDEKNVRGPKDRPAFFVFRCSRIDNEGN